MTNHRHEPPNQLLTFLRPASAEAQTPAHCGDEFRADYSSVASENRRATASFGCEYIAPVSDTESYAPFVSGSILELNDNRDKLVVRLPRGVIDAAADAEATKTTASAHQPRPSDPGAGDSRRDRCANERSAGHQQPVARPPEATACGNGALNEELEAVEDEDEGNSWDRAQAYNDYLRECDV